MFNQEKQSNDNEDHTQMNSFHDQLVHKVKLYPTLHSLKSRIYHSNFKIYQLYIPSF